jgi:hypothetical protein
MTATSHSPDTLLSISPIAELGPEMRHGATDDGTLDFFGWCQDWCDIKNEITGRESGTPVSEHGVHCIHTFTYIDGRTPDGHETFVRVDLVAAYIHGVYEHEEFKKVSRDAFLRFTTFDAEDQDGDPLSEFFFSTGDARKLARALGLAADRLDNLR